MNQQISKKKFEEMCREELLDTKMVLQNQIQSVKARLAQAKQVAAATGAFLPPEEFNALEERRRQINWLLSKVDSQLRKCRGVLRTPDTRETLAERFMSLAKETLEPGLYNHLVEEARSRP